MQLLNMRYAADDLVTRLIQATGGRANLIALLCNEMLPHLTQRDRVISPAVLARALDSPAVRTALAGWQHLTDNEAANRLDRLIVYATIERKQFTLADLLAVFNAQGYAYDPEQLPQALARLELAFMLRRQQQTYTFCVPLFVRWYGLRSRSNCCGMSYAWPGVCKALRVPEGDCHHSFSRRCCAPPARGSVRSQSPAPQQAPGPSVPSVP